MSTPRVGSSRISTFGPISSQRDEQHLLLVAARERADRDERARRAHAERLEGRLGPLCRALAEVEHAAGAGVALEHAHVDVVAARHVEEQAVPLAVLGQVDDAEIDGVQRGPEC